MIIKTYKNKRKDVSEFKKTECHKMCLITGSDWPAKGFYEKLGYVKTGEHKKHYFKRDFWIYSKLI